MKKRISIIVVVLLVLTSIMVTAATDGIKVTVDGNAVSFTSDSGIPFIDGNSRTQVPFRQVLEAFGATVEWNQSTKTATAKKADITVEIPIGTDYVVKNGERITNDTNSLIKSNRTYLPIRIVLESFGASVVWDSKAQTVIVVSQEGAATTSLNAKDPYSTGQVPIPVDLFPEDVMFIGNKITNIFHFPDCSLVQNMEESNMIYIRGGESTSEYKNCLVCGS